MATIGCFRILLDHLQSIRSKCDHWSHEIAFRWLELEIRLLRPIYTWIRKCEGVERCESVVRVIEDALPKFATEVESFYLRLYTDDFIERPFSVEREFDESIQFVVDDLEELHLICSNSTALQKSALPEDELLNQINSLAENLQDVLGIYQFTPDAGFHLIQYFDPLDANVRFLKSFICFAPCEASSMPRWSICWLSLKNLSSILHSSLTCCFEVTR